MNLRESGTLFISSLLYPTFLAYRRHKTRICWIHQWTPKWGKKNLKKTRHKVLRNSLCLALHTNIWTLPNHSPSQAMIKTLPRHLGHYPLPSLISFPPHPRFKHNFMLSLFGKVMIKSTRKLCYDISPLQRLCSQGSAKGRLDTLHLLFKNRH